MRKWCVCPVCHLGRRSIFCAWVGVDSASTAAPASPVQPVRLFIHASSPRIRRFTRQGYRSAAPRLHRRRRYTDRGKEGPMFSLWISINTMSLAFALWIGGVSGAALPSGGQAGFLEPRVCRGVVNCWVGAAKAKVTFEARESGTNPAGGVFTYQDVTPTGFTRTFRLNVTRVGF